MMREEYGRSKRWFNYTPIGNVVLLILALMTILFGDHIAMGVLALIILVFIFYARCFYTNRYEVAEKMRRLLLLMDSLGVKPSQTEIAQFGAEIGRSKIKTINFVSPYYASALATGYDRLADNIGESAYFTKYLAKHISGIFAGISLIGIGVVVILLATVSCIDSGNKEIVSRMLITATAFFSVGDFSWIALQFYRLYLVADRTLTKSEKMASDPRLDIIDVFRLMQDYNCSLIQTPPIPDLCIRLWGDKLNRSWRQDENTGKE